MKATSFRCAVRLLNNSGPQGLKKGAVITNDYLDGLKKDEWFKINPKDEDAGDFIERAGEQIKRHKEAFDRRFREKQAKITAAIDGGTF